MYNRYIPEDASYTRVGQDPPPSPPPPPSPRGRPEGEDRPAPVRTPDLGGLSSLLGGRGLSGALKQLRLDQIDPGDILLLLIALYLLVEGEDVDLAIALGAVFLMGLGEGRE